MVDIIGKLVTSCVDGIKKEPCLPTHTNYFFVEMDKPTYVDEVRVYTSTQPGACVEGCMCGCMHGCMCGCMCGCMH